MRLNSKFLTTPLLKIAPHRKPVEYTCSFWHLTFFDLKWPNIPFSKVTLYMYALALHPRAYGARSHLASTALDPLRLLAARSEFPGREWRARGLERRSLTLMTICTVYECHMPNFVQIRSKLWPCIGTKNRLTHTKIKIRYTYQAFRRLLAVKWNLQNQ